MEVLQPSPDTDGADHARTAAAGVVGELGEACREVAATFDGIDDELAARLRKAFA